MMRLATSLLLLSTSTFADVQTSYDALNAKFSECSAIQPISGDMRDKWLESQSESVVKTMLLMLKHRAFQQCIADADKDLADPIMQFACDASALFFLRVNDALGELL